MQSARTVIPVTLIFILGIVCRCNCTLIISKGLTTATKHFQYLDLRTGDYSWYTLLFAKRNLQNEQFERLPCSAALISPEFVLTSAACIKGHESWTKLTVKVGKFKTRKSLLKMRTSTSKRRIRLSVKSRRVVRIFEQNGLALMHLNRQVKNFKTVQIDSFGLSETYDLQGKFSLKCD